MKPRDPKLLEKAVGHRFRKKAVLEQALTHSSLARELEAQNAAKGQATPVSDNEMLEFLGDAVLGFVTSQALFERYPEFHEGQLSKLRAHLVSGKHLIRAAKKLHLGRFLRLGRGEEKSGGRNKIALQVNALEAVVAALYLDGGLEKARKLVLGMIVDPELKRLKRQMAKGLPITDFKSALQEALHSASRPQPAYVLVKEEGPEHNKTFTVEARIGRSDGKPDYVGCGEGTTKKKAEQDAAQQVLEYLWAVAAEEQRKARAAKSRARQ